MKRGSLDIIIHFLLLEHAHNTSKAASEVLVGSLIGFTNLDYVVHIACVCRVSADARKQREYSEIVALMKKKDLSDGAVMHRLQ